jgi:hypothetical protein
LFEVFVELPVKRGGPGEKVNPSHCGNPEIVRASHILLRKL